MQVSDEDDEGGVGLPRERGREVLGHRAIAIVALRAAARALRQIERDDAQVAAGLATTFASSYTAQVSLPGALSLVAIAGYGRQATGSKYVIIPNRAA